MFAFQFQLRTKIVFEHDAIALLGKELTGLGVSKALIVTDKGLMSTGMVDDVQRSLRRQGIDCRVFDGVQPNPSTAIIEAGYLFYRGEQADGIVAIGGGSSIDTAKGIAILATNGGAISDYFGAFKVRHPAAPLIAIPTTAGTGSEVSTQVSVKDERTQSKHAIRSFYAQPSVAILDPRLLSTLPKKIAVETGLDALTHLIEGYVSKGATPITDTLSRYGIELFGKHFLDFVQDRSRPEAAANMLLAAMLGGIVLSHARTGAVHTITRPMGGGISHGLANAVMLPYCMEFNLDVSIRKFADIARLLGEEVTGDEREDALKAVQHVRRLNEQLGIPSSVKDLGITEEQIDTIAQQAYELDISKLNPRELGVKEIKEILASAL